MRGSLQLRINLIAIFFGLCIALSLTAVGAYFIHMQLESGASARARLTGAELAAQVERLLDLGLKVDEIIGFDEICRLAAEKDSTLHYAGIYGLEGQVRFGSRPAAPHWPFSGAAGDGVLEREAEGLLFVAYPVQHGGSPPEAYALTVVDGRVIWQRTWEVVTYFAAIAAGLIAVSLLAHFLFLRRTVTQPLAELVEAVDAVHADNVNHLPPLRHAGVGEIGALARAFAGLLQRLSDARNALLAQNLQLERLVQERTVQLERANAALRDDIDRRKLLEEELRTLANTDALTGLHNRAFIMPYLGERLEAVRRQDRSLTVLIFDFNEFKEINDTHGHAAGDAVLREMAARMRGICRHSDVLARLGGDEFLVILEDGDDAGAQRFAEKMRRIFESPVMIGDVRLRLGVSIGAAFYPRHGSDLTSLLAAADQAMYRAKQQGTGFALA